MVIPGRQGHIRLVMKVRDVWGNILHGVNILDGVVGQGEVQGGNPSLPITPVLGWLAGQRV